MQTRIKIGKRDHYIANKMNQKQTLVRNSSMPCPQSSNNNNNNNTQTTQNNNTQAHNNKETKKQQQQKTYKNKNVPNYSKEHKYTYTKS